MIWTEPCVRPIRITMGESFSQATPVPPEPEHPFEGVWELGRHSRYDPERTSLDSWTCVPSAGSGPEGALTTPTHGALALSADERPLTRGRFILLGWAMAAVASLVALVCLVVSTAGVVDHVDIGTGLLRESHEPWIVIAARVLGLYCGYLAWMLWHVAGRRSSYSSEGVRGMAILPPSWYAVFTRDTVPGCIPVPLIGSLLLGRVGVYLAWLLRGLRIHTARHVLLKADDRSAPLSPFWGSVRGSPEHLPGCIPWHDVLGFDVGSLGASGGGLFVPMAYLKDGRRCRLYAAALRRSTAQRYCLELKSAKARKQNGTWPELIQSARKSWWASDKTPVTWMNGDPKITISHAIGLDFPHCSFANDSERGYQLEDPGDGEVEER